MQETSNSINERIFTPSPEDVKHEKDLLKSLKSTRGFQDDQIIVLASNHKEKRKNARVMDQGNN